MCYKTINICCNTPTHTKLLMFHIVVVVFSCKKSIGETHSFVFKFRFDEKHKVYVNLHSCAVKNYKQSDLRQGGLTEAILVLSIVEFLQRPLALVAKCPQHITQILNGSYKENEDIPYHLNHHFILIFSSSFREKKLSQVGCLEFQKIKIS